MKKILLNISIAIFGKASVTAFRARLSFLKIKFFNGSYFALNNLDRKLEKYVDYDNGFFVELGANDGVDQSNSLYFELNRGWKGLLIEPCPNKFLSCNLNRSPQNHIFCNACVSFEYKKNYVDITYGNLMSISKNLELDVADKHQHIVNSKQFLAPFEPIFNFGAVAMTLTALLDKSKAPKLIDFISLDVEGAELEVLKGIDFSKYNFKFMLIEIRDLELIDKFLNMMGYNLVEKFSHHDYLFKFESSNKKVIRS
jgi:FkbM family methyltransferase